MQSRSQVTTLKTFGRKPQALDVNFWVLFLSELPYEEEAGITRHAYIFGRDIEFAGRGRRLHRPTLALTAELAAVDFEFEKQLWKGTVLGSFARHLTQHFRS